MGRVKIPEEPEPRGFAEAFAETGSRSTALRSLLRDLMGAGARIVGCRRFGPRVRRVYFERMNAHRSIIVKQLDPVVAQRTRSLAERWLPAVGLSALGPGLLGCAAESGGGRAWQVYRDFGHAGLDRDPNDRRRVRAAVRAIAGLHLRFADHPLLAECRLGGGDLGPAFYGGSVRDALRALEALGSGSVALSEAPARAREALLGQLQRLLDEEDERVRELRAEGGPETLVHGDLWPQNVFVLESDHHLPVRLIDWDHVGVAGFSYDLSTLLLRFPRAQRWDILADYEETMAREGWQLPNVDTLNRLFDTAERARIASQIAWPTLALLRRDTALRDWAQGNLVDVSRWFEELAPVLVVEQSAVA
jgi:hypothetical protein